MEFKSRILAVIETGRPLIWLFSIVSALCGMMMAVRGLPPLNVLIIVLVGVGPCVTAAINLLNAIFDVKVDAISKPARPLPSGRLGVSHALATAFLLYAIGLLLAWSLGVWPLIFTAIGLVLSVAYSVPPVRLKGRGILANLTLALGYTTIIILGGWSIFRDVSETPWFIVALLTIQVTGANVVKDFVDYEGDKALNIRTLPVRYGIKKAALLISPLMVGIYLLIPFLYVLGIFSWRYLPITLLAAWGIYIIKSSIRNPSRRSREKIFVQAFFMSLITEIFFTTAYILEF